MATNEINLKITIDGKDAQGSIKLTDAELKKLAVSMRQAGNDSRNTGESIVHSFAQARNLIQGLKETFSMFSQTFQTHLSAYQAQEGALIKLNTALAQSGNLTDENVKSLVDYSSQLQQTTIYGDEVTQTVMAQLTAMGLTVEQTKAATLQAANLATVMGTDLNGAARAMADLFNGNTGMIGRYVKGLDETIIKSGDLDKIMAMLNERIGGQAEAMGKSAAGQIARMNNAIGDLKENTGELLSKALAPFINSISDIIGKLNNLSPGLSGAIGLIGSMTTAFVTLRITGILPAIKSVELFGVALTGLRATLVKTGIGALIVALGYGLYELAKAYEHFADVSGQADRSYSNVLNVLRSEAVNAKKEELEWMLSDAEKSRDKLKGDLEKLKADVQAATTKRRIMDKEGNEYFITQETEKSKTLQGQIKQTEQLLKLEEDKIKIYEQVKNKTIEIKPLTEDQLKALFEKNKTELAEQQRHKEALLRLETTNEYAILNQKLLHYDQMIALHKMYNQDVTRLVNERKIAELQLSMVEPLGGTGTFLQQKKKEFQIEAINEETVTALKQRHADIRKNIMRDVSEFQMWLHDEEAQAQVSAAATAFGEIGNMVGKNTALGQMAAVAQSIYSTYTAATKALEAGPILGPILAGLITVLGMANVAKIKETAPPTGYAMGGRLSAGKSGFIEGYHNEIIAPEKTFVEVFKQELRPQIYNQSPASSFNIGETLNKLNKRLDEGIKVEGRMKKAGRDFVTEFRQAEQQVDKTFKGGSVDRN